MWQEETMFWQSFWKITEQLSFPHWLLRSFSMVSGYMVMFLSHITVQGKDWLYWRV